MEEKYFPEVIQAVAGNGNSIYVYFSDGKITLYDVESLINKGGVLRH